MNHISKGISWDLDMDVAVIALFDGTRLRLETVARERSTPVGIVHRSRIFLLAGEGLQN